MRKIILLCCILQLTLCGMPRAAQERLCVPGKTVNGFLPSWFSDMFGRETPGVVGNLLGEILKPQIPGRQSVETEEDKIPPGKATSISVSLDEANKCIRWAVRVTVDNNKMYAERLRRMAIYMLKERRIENIFAEGKLVEWIDLEDTTIMEENLPEGLLAELSQAYLEGTVREFADAYAADYEILSSEEIKEYAESNEVLYHFCQEMEGEYIWYRLPLDYPENLVICGKHSYKFDGRDTGRGVQIPDGELYFICRGGENLILTVDETWGRVTLQHYYLPAEDEAEHAIYYNKGDIFILEKAEESVEIYYYKYDIWQWY